MLPVVTPDRHPPTPGRSSGPSDHTPPDVLPGCIYDIPAAITFEPLCTRNAEATKTVLETFTSGAEAGWSSPHPPPSSGCRMQGSGQHCLENECGWFLMDGKGPGVREQRRRQQPWQDDESGRLPCGGSGDLEKDSQFAPGFPERMTAECPIESKC